jgi:hypothetical protein
MKVFYIKARPVGAEGPPASAFVVAHDEHEAVVLLRKDIDFSGYRLPPVEMTPYSASHEQVREVLGDAATHEIGVYGFRVLGEPLATQAGTPPRALC